MVEQEHSLIHMATSLPTNAQLNLSQHLNKEDLVVAHLQTLWRRELLILLFLSLLSSLLLQLLPDRVVSKLRINESLISNEPTKRVQ